MKIYTEKKLALLEKQQKQISDQIKKIKEINSSLLAKAVNIIIDLEKIDLDLALGIIINATQNIPDNQKEVLRNSGKAFRQKYKTTLTPNKNITQENAKKQKTD